jgi:hypothetical protein
MISIADAIYTPSTLPELAGNPMTEALPNELEPDEFTRAVSHFPQFKASDRQLPDNDRLLASYRLGRCVVATSDFYDIYKRIYTLIKSGYIGKNPLLPTVVKWTYDIAKNNTFPEKTTADTLMITGLSGGGKTTIINGVLRCFPNVIDHSQYQGKPFVFRQIIYIRLDMPGNSSRSAICLEMFKQFDLALGTDYAKQYGRHGVKIDVMQQAIATIAATHMLGAIFIDEFHNINIARSGGKEAALNFFDQLSNTVKVPIIKIGTPAALKIFIGQFRSSRRAGTSGLIEINRYSEDSPAWEYLVKAAWRYQWVKTTTTLTKSLRNALYQYSQGIPYCLFRLLELANRHAISLDLEVIDEKVLMHVYKTQFGLIAKALSALRTGGTESYEDLMRCDEVLRNQKGSTQLRELISFAKSHQFSGAAAGHLSSYIEDSIAEFELTERERNTLSKLKEKLLIASEENAGTSVIEGEIQNQS